MGVETRPIARTADSYVWAKWVIMHYILGYKPLHPNEVEDAFKIIKNHEEKDGAG